MLTLHSPGRHGCSHEKQARPLVPSRAKPQSLTAKPAPFTLTYLELLGQCHLSSSGSAGGHTTQGKPWRSRQTWQSLQTALWRQWYAGVWMRRPVPWLCTLKTHTLAQIKTKFLGNWTAPLNRTGSYILHVTSAWWCGQLGFLGFCPARDQEGRQVISCGWCRWLYTGISSAPALVLPLLSTLIQTLAGKMKGLQCVTHEAPRVWLTCVFSLEVFRRVKPLHDWAG